MEDAVNFPWLFPGAKVVCADVQQIDGRLVYGEVYTITNAFLADGLFKGEWVNDLVAVTLAEKANFGVNGDAIQDFGFAAERFRPLLPDTKGVVEELKQGMRDAAKRGEPVAVDA